MATLFIFGNGFDLKHNLPTSYVPYLKDLAIKSERFMGEWDCYSEDFDLWSDVEENLAFPDTQMFMEHLGSYAPDMLSEHESDRDAIIYEADQLLDFPLEEFAKQADKAIEQTHSIAKLRRMFKPDDFFLTFNYTHTLEYLYSIQSTNILHIHGEVGGEPLIMGFAPESRPKLPELHRWDDEGDFEYYTSTAHNLLEERIFSLEKQYQTKKLAEFLQAIREEISQVIVYGFSFGKVDMPYFTQLAQCLGQIPWTISAYSQEALEDACGRFEDYNCGISYTRKVCYF